MSTSNKHEIDFVIPWVDGADPIWYEKKAKYSGLNTGNGNIDARFRDWGILKYWFRAVEQYAPWVRFVHFVTDNQCPEWLNLDHPKLKWVKHTDYLPEEYLPTFCSRTIELNFHRISGIAEQFVYFNDDMFLNTAVTPEDFFYNGKPRDCAVLTTFSPLEIEDTYTHAQCNDIAVMNTHFNKREVLANNLKLWFNPIYGKYILKNLYGLATRHFSNFQNNHIPSAMLKSTYNLVWELEPHILHGTCLNKFHSMSDVNQYIMSYYNICSGNFVPRSPYFGKCYGIERDDEEMLDDMLHERHKVICINDHAKVSDFEEEKEKLIAAFEEKLPKKSSFER